MKTTKRGILSRLTRSGRESKKHNKVTSKPAGVSESTLKADEEPSASCHNVSSLGPTLSGISEDLQSSESSESNVTTASDLMKCLNTLRIQEPSVTNSNSTPSVASIPRLAPPPLPLLSRQISAQPDGSSEMYQTWPSIEVTNLEKSKIAHQMLQSTESEDKISAEKPNDVTGLKSASNTWIAFTPEVQQASRQNGRLEEDMKKGMEEITNSADSVDGESITECQQENDVNEELEEPSLSFHSIDDQSMSSANDHQAVYQQEKQEQYSDKKCESAFRNNWRDSDEDSSADVDNATTKISIAEINPFALPCIQKTGDSESIANKSLEEANLDSILKKYGSPLLELVERVDACFSGNKLTKYKVIGEVKFKLSGGCTTTTQSVLSSEEKKLSQTVSDCLEVYRLVLRLKCVLQHVFLKQIVVKKGLMESEEPNTFPDHQHHPNVTQEQDKQSAVLDRKSSLTMNESKKGVVESKIMHWNLTRCFQEALINPITLMRYPVQPNILCGPPLLVQIHWQRPRRPGNPVLVDVTVQPNCKLSTSLWGVTICLKGFRKHQDDKGFVPKEALARPEAKWNASDCSFEWSIPIINPQDAPQHLKVKICENQNKEIPDYNLSTSVKFVMPHSTLSGTLVLGWLEKKYTSECDALFGDEGTNHYHHHHHHHQLHHQPTAKNDAKEGRGLSSMIKENSNLIFCEKMCMSGEYEANTDY